MRGLSYGKYTIYPRPRKTGGIYRRRGPHLLKCACPGCQNFFKAITPYIAELDASTAPLGIAWNKPDSIQVLDASRGQVYYKIDYSFYGTGELPAKWHTEKTALGTVNLRLPNSVYRLNEEMSFEFFRAGKERLRLEVSARLPWVMETMNCIYDPSEKAVAKKLPGRAARIYRGAAHIIRSFRQR